MSMSGIPYMAVDTPGMSGKAAPTAHVGMTTMAVKTVMSQETGVQMPICGEKIAFTTPEKTWNHMEQKMSIDKLVRILKKNGWKKSPNITNGWYHGLATIFFSTDRQGEYIIELPDNNWGYVSMISNVKTNYKQLRINWKSSEYWELIY